MLFKISHGKSGDTTKSTKPLPAGGTRKILRGTQPGAVITAVVYGSSGEVPDAKVPAKPHPGNHFIAVKVGLRNLGKRLYSLDPAVSAAIKNDKGELSRAVKGTGLGQIELQKDETAYGRLFFELPDKTSLSSFRFRPFGQRESSPSFRSRMGRQPAGRSRLGEATPGRRHAQDREARPDDAQGSRLRQLRRASSRTSSPVKARTGTPHRRDQVRAAEHAGRPLPRQSEPQPLSSPTKRARYRRAPVARDAGSARSRSSRTRASTAASSSRSRTRRPRAPSASAPSGSPTSQWSSRSRTGGATRSA